MTCAHRSRSRRCRRSRTNFPIWPTRPWRRPWPSAGPRSARTRCGPGSPWSALGKCGAQELNYVSDVDVLFVAEPALDDEGQPLLSTDAAITAATRMAAELTRICSAHTKAGTIWEVDAAPAPRGQDPASSSAPWPATRSTTRSGRRPGSSRPCSRRGRAPVTSSWARPSSTWSRRWCGRAPNARTSSPTSQAMRKRVVAHIPARDAGRELKLGRGRPPRRRVLGAVAATGARPRRRAAATAGDAGCAASN